MAHISTALLNIDLRVLHMRFRGSNDDFALIHSWNAPPTERVYSR